MPYNVSIDVDLTLIDKDGQLLPKANDAITKLKSADCNITLWSLAGAEYAKSIALKHKIENLFVGFAGKPDVAIDDDLESFNPRLKFEVTPKTDWGELVGRVLKQIEFLEGKAGDRKALISLVSECQLQLQTLRDEYENNLFPTGLNLHPVPFFGNPFQAEILTIALNPSFTEFNPERHWEQQLDTPRLIGKLLPYFEQKPHRWFDQLEMALLYFGSSYETNAAQVDLFPHPTLWPRRMDNTQKTQLAHLIRNNTHHLKRVLKLCRSVKLVLIIDYTFTFGQGNCLSVFNTLQEFIPAAAQNDGSAFPTRRFSGPNLVAEWAFTNRHCIREHLLNSNPIEF